MHVSISICVLYEEKIYITYLIDTMITRCKYKKLKYIVEDNEIGIFDKSWSPFLSFNFVYNLL